VIGWKTSIRKVCFYKNDREDSEILGLSKEEQLVLLHAKVQTKANGKLISIKQERKLLSQLLVVAKSFAIKDAIGDFEFS